MFADGEEEWLPCIASMYVEKGATEAERKKQEEEFYARNRAVEKLLEEKGFVMTDDAHVSAQVNRYLATHPEASCSC